MYKVVVLYNMTEENMSFKNYSLVPFIGSLIAMVQNGFYRNNDSYSSLSSHSDILFNAELFENWIGRLAYTSSVLTELINKDNRLLNWISKEKPRNLNLLIIST